MPESDQPHMYEIKSSLPGRFTSSFSMLLFGIIIVMIPRLFQSQASSNLLSYCIAKRWYLLFFVVLSVSAFLRAPKKITLTRTHLILESLFGKRRRIPLSSVSSYVVKHASLTLILRFEPKITISGAVYPTTDWIKLMHLLSESKNATVEEEYQVDQCYVASMPTPPISRRSEPRANPGHSSRATDPARFREMGFRDAFLGLGR